MTILKQIEAVLLPKKDGPSGMLTPLFHPRPWGSPDGPIEKSKRSFVHHGLLKLTYKFH